MVVWLTPTSRSWATGEAVSFYKFSLIFLRSLCDVSSSSGASSVSDNPAAKSKKRKKKKNLMEVLKFLPNWGIGYHVAKSHWEDVSYEVTKINLYRGGGHGKAWGIAYKKGVPADAPRRIGGVNKRCWRYIPNVQLSKKKSSPPASSDSTKPSEENASFSAP